MGNFLGTGVDLGELIKQKSKELAQKIDLSGAKLPGVKTQVDLGEDTRKLLIGFGVLLLLWIVSKIL